MLQQLLLKIHPLLEPGFRIGTYGEAPVPDPDQAYQGHAHEAVQGHPDGQFCCPHEDGETSADAAQDNGKHEQGAPYVPAHGAQGALVRTVLFPDPEHPSSRSKGSVSPDSRLDSVGDEGSKGNRDAHPEVVRRHIPELKGEGGISPCFHGESRQMTVRISRPTTCWRGYS